MRSLNLQILGKRHVFRGQSVFFVCMGGRGLAAFDLLGRRLSSFESQNCVVRPIGTPERTIALLLEAKVKDFMAKHLQYVQSLVRFVSEISLAYRPCKRVIEDDS